MKTTILFYLFLVATSTVQAQFIKYEGNPVLRLGPAASWESKQVSHPRIIFDGKTYRMWYAGSNDTCRQIGYATSTDGINWTKDPNNPVLTVGQLGTIDNMVISPGAVVYDGNVYHMYYTARGFTNAGTICHATSPDGIVWTKDDVNNPVLKRGEQGWWDDYGLSAGPVLKQGMRWLMWYNGFRSDKKWYAGVATSSDGVHWIKDTLNNPLFEPGAVGDWDEDEQWITDVLHDGSYFEAFYFGNEKQSSIGYGVSRDGIVWGKYEGNPILTPERSTDKEAVLFQSSVLKISEQYRIWYSDGLTKQICLAQSEVFTPSNAQEKADKAFAANKPVAAATKSEAKPPAAKQEMKVTYENGIKIVGEKTFDVDIKNGNLYIVNARFDNGEYRSYEIDIRKKLEKMGISNTSIKDIKQVIYTQNDFSAYVLFESVVMKVTPSLKDRVHIAFTRAGDASKIFTHDGAIYTSSDGSIVASTPTTLLVITPTELLSTTYQSLFGNIPPFKKPIISGGRNSDEVFIRDETMANATGAVRLELDLKTLDINVAKDVLAALGSK